MGLMVGTQNKDGYAKEKPKGEDKSKWDAKHVICYNHSKKSYMARGFAKFKVAIQSICIYVAEHIPHRSFVIKQVEPN